MINDQAYFDKKATQILKQLKDEEVYSPQYLKTRLLMRLREHKNSKGVIFMWKKFAILSSSMAMIAIISLFLTYSGTNDFFKAHTGKPLLVRIAVEDIDKEQISFARIELPDGVDFFSKKFPEINKERVLVLDWENALIKAHLPFVIQGKEVGKKILKISFLSKEMQVIGKKEFRVNFRINI